MDVEMIDKILKNNHDVIVVFTDKKTLCLKRDGIPVSIFNDDDIKVGWGALITVAGFVLTQNSDSHHVLYPWQSVLNIHYWRTEPILAKRKDE
jgi:hypothetical protein